MVKHIYLIGSLRNPEVPKVAKILREAGHDCFDDWYCAGPEADDHWQKYEQDRGHNYAEALNGHAAKHVYEYDRSHLDRCGVGVLLMPAGKSGHLELGYMIGQGKPGYILTTPETERWDVMYKFASGVFTNVEGLINVLSGPEIQPRPEIRPRETDVAWKLGVDTAFKHTGEDSYGRKVYGGYNSHG